MKVERRRMMFPGITQLTARPEALRVAVVALCLSIAILALALSYV